MGTVTFPARGFCGSLGTGTPLGLVSVIDPTLGRNATGDTERISKPRRSFSPPMYERWNGGATNPPKPLMKEPWKLNPTALRRFCTGMNFLYCTMGRMERTV